MIKAIVFDLSYTLLFPKDKSYREELNKLYKDIKDLPDFNFTDYFYLDEEIVGYVRTLKGERDLYMFTSGVIQNAPEIKERLEKLFKVIYSAEEMGISKSDPSAYTKLAKTMGYSPSEILFIDDSERNINAAKTAGLNTIQFKNLENFKNSINPYLSSKKI